MKRKPRPKVVSAAKSLEHARRTNVPSSVTVHVPLTLHLRGGRKTVISPVPQSTLPPPSPRFDNALVKAIVRAHRWRRMIEHGDYLSITELAKAEGVNQSYACRLLRLTLLAPDIVEDILNGVQPPQLSLTSVLGGFPIFWAQQRRLFGHRSCRFRYSIAESAPGAL